MIDAQEIRTLPTEEIMANLRKSLFNKENIVFVNIPQVNAPEWPADVKRMFRKCYGNR